MLVLAIIAALTSLAAARAIVIRWRRRWPILSLTLAALAALAALTARAGRRGTEQFLDGQLSCAVPIQLFEGLRRVIDLVRLDDVVVVCVERPDNRRRPMMPALAARGRAGSLPVLVGARVLWGWSGRGAVTLPR